MKFNVGDKVLSERGQFGIIKSIHKAAMDERQDTIHLLLVDNEFQYWRKEGLRYAEEKELWPCKKCKMMPSQILDEYYLSQLKCKCGIETCWYDNKEAACSMWNLYHGKKPRDLKKGDVVYIKAIVGNPEEDEEGDIRIAYASRKSAGYEEWAHTDAIFTLEELQEMKDERD